MVFQLDEQLILSRYSSSMSSWLCHGVLVRWSVDTPSHGVPVRRAVDTPSHGVLARWAVDTPSHGVPARWAVDTPSHGVRARWAVDTPSHGVPVRWAVDTSSHGVPARWAVDTPSHGAPARWAVDTTMVFQLDEQLILLWCSTVPAAIMLVELSLVLIQDSLSMSNSRCHIVRSPILSQHRHRPTHGINYIMHKIDITDPSSTGQLYDMKIYWKNITYD